MGKRIIRKSMKSQTLRMVVVGVAHHMSHAMTVISNVVNEVHKEVNIMVEVVIEVVNTVVNNVATMNTPRHKGQDVVIIVRVVVTEVVMVNIVEVVKVQNLLDTNTKEMTLDFF